jgi:hypothetical protein
MSQLLSDPIRLVAIAAVIGVLVWPYIGQARAQLHRMLSGLRPFPMPKEGIDAQDLAMILDLAARLKKDGNDKAAKIAKQLLDAVLEVPAS